MTVLRWLVRTYCSKMLRIAWKMDDEYQQKSFYSLCLPTHLSIVATEYFLTESPPSFLAFWTYRRKTFSQYHYLGRFSQTNLMLRHVAQRLIEAILINNRFLHLLILKVGMFKLETLDHMCWGTFEPPGHWSLSRMVQRSLPLPFLHYVSQQKKRTVSALNVLHFLNTFLDHITFAKNLSKKAACHLQKQKNAGTKILLSSFNIKISPQKLIWQL